MPKATERPIILLGASGMLGSALLHELRSRGLAHRAPMRSDLALDDEDVETALAACAPSAVLNAAAYTDVARAELRSEAAVVRRLNRDGPGRVAGACRRMGIPFVHVSTDYVFDGRKNRPYTEDDPPAPLQVYGWSKLEGERAVVAAHPDALIVRTSTLYGPGRELRPHYVTAVLRQARERQRLDLVRLPVSCPTYSVDLARGLLDLLAARATGVVHVVNEGGCSRLELAREALRLSGLVESTVVLERSTPPGPPRRPPYTVLDGSCFRRWTGRAMRPWREALADYLSPSSGRDSGR